MANNRLRIKCRVCGETFPIAKTLGSGYYLSPAFSEKGLAEFLDDHAFCRNGDEVGDEGDFCLAYEFPAEGQETFISYEG